MRQYILALSSLAMAAAALAGAAQASTEGYYYSGLTGVSIMPDLGLKGSTGTSVSSFDVGYAYGGAFGYDTGNGWRFELDSIHQMSFANQLNGASAGGHLWSTGLMANVSVDLMPKSQFTPYIGAGLGFQNVGGMIDGLYGDKWRPAYQFEAGLRDDISPRFSLFGEYRFTQSGAVELSDGIDTANQHFSDHLLMIGLTYHLGRD